MNSRNRKPYEETEIFCMVERLYRNGDDTADTEQERGVLLMATTDMALAKLIEQGADRRAADYYRSEECRSECMLKALEALAKASTDNGRAMVNYLVKAIQNRARTLLDQDVKSSLRNDYEFDLDTLPAKE